MASMAALLSLGVGLLGACADGAGSSDVSPASTMAGSLAPSQSAVPTAAPTSAADAGATSSPGPSAVPTEPTGVPGLDDGDEYCAVWAVYAGTLQAISVAQAFGDLTDLQVARLEIIAAPHLLQAVNGIAAHWPAALMTENPVALSDLIGPYDRRARKALQYLTDQGATDDDIAELTRLWDDALRGRDPNEAVIRVNGLTGELEELVDQAAAAFDAVLTPFSSDPSLDVSNVSTPLTDQYLADYCPDLASSGVGDPV